MSRLNLAGEKRALVWACIDSLYLDDFAAQIVGAEVPGSILKHFKITLAQRHHKAISVG